MAHAGFFCSCSKTFALPVPELCCRLPTCLHWSSSRPSELLRYQKHQQTVAAPDDTWLPSSVAVEGVPDDEGDAGGSAGAGAVTADATAARRAAWAAGSAANFSLASRLPTSSAAAEASRFAAALSVRANSIIVEGGSGPTAKSETAASTASTASDASEFGCGFVAAGGASPLPLERPSGSAAWERGMPKPCDEVHDYKWNQTPVTEHRVRLHPHSAD